MAIDGGRRRPRARDLATLLAALLVGCSGTDTGDSGADSATCTGTVALADANNFSFTGSLDVPSIATVSGADIDICWDQVVDDLQCHAMDPVADVDTVGLVRFGTLTQAEVQAGLSANDLQQSELTGYVQYDNSGDAPTSCTTLSAMSFFGTPVDVASEYVEGGGAYLLLLSTGSELGVGTRMLSFLDPQASSTNTAADVPSGCGVLDFAADLSTLSPATACAADTVVDWSGVTVDGQGNPLTASDIDGLLLGRFEGQTLAEIEGDFLNLESRATTLYELPLTGGTSADLSAAVSADGPFPGFDPADESIWLLALTCSRCYNPAPLVVTVIEPR